MRVAAAIRVAIVVLAMVGPVIARAEDDPSIKEGFKELGRGIENDTEKGWEATKDVTEKGWDATKKGTGTALQKTGEGLNNAGEAVEGAGDNVKGEDPPPPPAQK